MPAKDQAAYMRAYRAKKRGTPSVPIETPDLGQGGEGHTSAFYEGEIARLKRLLAQCQRDLILSRVNRSK